MKLFRKVVAFFYLASLLVSCRNARQETGTVSVNGVSLFYTVCGPEGGKPVVLVHGNGGSHKSMRTQALQLARKGYRVYSPDSRGQGRNAPLSEYHYADMAEDTYCFIKALGLEQPALYGWSDGGIIALLLETEHSGTCSLIALSGANLYPDCGEGFEEFKAYILKLGTPLAMMMLDEPQIDPASLSAIKCPALVTVGSKDLISVEHTKLIADSIPGSELVIFEGETHGSYIKGSPKMGRCLLDFFARNNY
ncbi:MAG: alpha/beta hydrolase [Bacteroidales bacterium]|nr:alpha/beta hydrolase [Candidatus Cryptobacteroides aphodequi]